MCRLPVPLTSQILTRNRKRNREFITRKELAFEVAELMKGRIESIRDETGRPDITFENMVLPRLLHVSRVPWQPELWREGEVAVDDLALSPEIRQYGGSQVLQRPVRHMLGSPTIWVSPRGGGLYELAATQPSRPEPCEDQSFELGLAQAPRRRISKTGIAVVL